MTTRILSQIAELDLDRCANTYGVAPCTAAGAPGGECHQTFRTCQDKPNYVRTVQTVKFTLRGAPIPPGQPCRPYITKIERAPSKLDPDEGLATRGTSTIVMRDETDADVEMDPYVRNRLTPAGGTYWTRFMARNRSSYAGRPVRLKQCLVDLDAAGNYVFGAVTTERYIIDSIKGPTGKGEVTVVLKDQTKLLDNAKAPVPTTGKLAVQLGPSDLVIQLGSGEAAQYDAAGWVRIRDEVIRYASKAGNTLVLANGTYRANFGTAVDTHKVGTVVQQCLVFQAQSISDVLHALYNRSGIDDADIDLAGLADEDATWLGNKYLITTCIASPEKISTLVKEICQQTQLMAWWSATAQKHKFKVYAPSSPGTASATLNDLSSFREGTIEGDRLDDKRITRSVIWFSRRSAVANQTEAKSYEDGESAIDLDAESAREYDDYRPESLYSRWFTSDNVLAMRALVQRRLARYRDAPEDLKKFSLDPKDGAIAEGDIRGALTKGYVDEHGQKTTKLVLVTSRKDLGVQVDYTGRITTFDRRYGFIAPAGTANYPSNNGYACVSSAAGRMVDGTEGYVVI